MDAAKSKGGVQAASLSSTPKAVPQQGVYVVERDPKGKLRAKFVPVTTGITGATDIEVVSGLTEGQEIVTRPLQDFAGLEERLPGQTGYHQTGHARRDILTTGQQAW